MLLKANRKESPYKSVFIDLEHWLRGYRTPRMEIVIYFDANEQWVGDSSITTFAQKVNLLNVNQEFELAKTHPNVANLDRITTTDFYLCSATVLRNIVYAGSTPYDREVLGDHRGFIIDLQLKDLFSIDRLGGTKAGRNLTLSNLTAVNKYLQEVETKFLLQNIFKRSKKLLKRVAQGHMDLASIMKQYEALDQEVHGICF